MGIAAGQIINDTDLARITALETPTLVVLRATIAVSIPNIAWTPVGFDFEEIDAGSWHSTASNTSRIQVPAGWYHVDAIGTFASNATGLRAVRLALTGAAIAGRSVWLPTNSAGQTATAPVSGPVRFGASDYVELQVFQSSGGPLNTSIDPAGAVPLLALRKIST